MNNIIYTTPATSGTTKMMQRLNHNSDLCLIFRNNVERKEKWDT